MTECSVAVVAETAAAGRTRECGLGVDSAGGTAAEMPGASGKPRCTATGTTKMPTTAMEAANSGAAKMPATKACAAAEAAAVEATAARVETSAATMEATAPAAVEATAPTAVEAATTTTMTAATAAASSGKGRAGQRNRKDNDRKPFDACHGTPPTWLLPPSSRNSMSRVRRHNFDNLSEKRPDRPASSMPYGLKPGNESKNDFRIGMNRLFALAKAPIDRT
jgi:hypothetical protein